MRRRRHVGSRSMLSDGARKSAKSIPTLTGSVSPPAVLVGPVLAPAVVLLVLHRTHCHHHHHQYRERRGEGHRLPPHGGTISLRAVPREQGLQRMHRLQRPHRIQVCSTMKAGSHFQVFLTRIGSSSVGQGRNSNGSHTIPDSRWCCEKRITPTKESRRWR